MYQTERLWNVTYKYTPMSVLSHLANNFFLIWHLFVKLSREMFRQAHVTEDSTGFPVGKVEQLKAAP